VDSQLKSSGLVLVRWVGSRVALFYIHQMNRVNSCNGSDDSTINIVFLDIIILILIVVRTYPRVCPRRAHDVAAKPRVAKPTRLACRGLASPRQSRAKAARGKAAYNLVIIIIGQI